MKKVLLISIIALSACNITSPITKQAKPTNQKKVDSLISIVNHETEISGAYQKLAQDLTDSAQAKYKSQHTEAMLGAAIALVTSSHVFNNLAKTHLDKAEKANNMAKKLNDEDIANLNK